MEHQQYQSIQKTLTLALALCVLLYLTARYQTLHFISHTDVLPELLQEPLQTRTDEVPFSFEYMGVHYDVQPVAEYHLWGLVVSHNNIHGLGDPHHQDDSVDTKDLCVMWGDNLKSDDFHKASFSSGPWTCYYKYPAGVTIRADELSNNHIVADSADLRRTLDGVRIGDQVEFRGMLVNYRDQRHPEFWRRTSTVRTDQEGFACEVVFIRDLRVLRRHVPGWYALRDHLPLAALILFLLKLALIAKDPGFRRPSAAQP